MYTRFNSGDSDENIVVSNEIVEESNLENLDNDLILHSLNAIRSMEIIDIRSGCKIGFVQDLVIDIEASKIVSIIIPSSGKNWFNKEEDIEIPWEKVVKAGMDVILVDTSK
ncbi:MAG: YlmC/YmxH family sporulation protein [Clostridium sp.]